MDFVWNQWNLLLHSSLCLLLVTEFIVDMCDMGHKIYEIVRVVSNHWFYVVEKYSYQLFVSQNHLNLYIFGGEIYVTTIIDNLRISVLFFFFFCMMLACSFIYLFGILFWFGAVLYFIIIYTVTIHKLQLLVYCINDCLSI